MHLYSRYYKLRVVLFCCFSVLFVSVFGQKNIGPTSKKSSLSEKNILLKIEQLIDTAGKAPNSVISLEFYEKAIDLADSIGNENLKARALYKSALLWKKRGEFIKAIERLNSSIEIFKKNGNQKHEYLIMIDLADTYRNCSEYDEAIQILDKAMEYFKKQKNNKALARIGNRKAAILFEKFYWHNKYVNLYYKGKREHQVFLDTLKKTPEIKHLYDDVMYWLIYSNKIANEFKYNNIIISNLNILGGLMNATFNFQKGIELYDEAIGYCKKYNIEEELPLLLINKARILGVQNLKQTKLAIQIAEEGLAIAQKQQERIYIFMASAVLEENYAAIGNYERAHFFLSYNHNLYKNFNNENININLKIRSFESKIEEREQEIQHRKYKLKMTYFFSSLLLAIFIFFTIMSFLKHRKQKLLNLELHEKSDIISSQINELKMLNSEKDRLISIIGHDLRTPFNSILGFGELLHEESEHLSKEEIHQYSGYIIQSSNNTLQLLENLLLWAKIQQNRIVFNVKSVLLDEIINDVSKTLHDNLQNKEIQLLVLFDKNIAIHADPEMLKTVIRNLIGNAIKFSKHGGIIEIYVEETPVENKIFISDNGIGIKKHFVDHIFEMESSTIKSENSIGNGHGLGLILCKEIIEEHGGTIGVKSEQGKGSTFYFSLPKR